MNTKYAVKLLETERAHLRTLLGRGTAPARQQTRARILLKANQGDGGPGWTDMAIAGALDVHPATVSRVRREYVTHGLRAALERSPPDRVYPRKADGALEAQVIAAACGTPPAGHARWTLRLLASELVRLEGVESVSYETVRRVLKQTDSSPG
jgi:transposase